MFVSDVVPLTLSLSELPPLLAKMESRAEKSYRKEELNQFYKRLQVSATETYVA